MTKTQGWAVVVLLIVLIGMFMIRNSNESDRAVNRAVADDTICYNTFRETYATLGEATTKKNLDDCLKQSALKNL